MKKHVSIPEFRTPSNCPFEPLRTTVVPEELQKCTMDVGHVKLKVIHFSCLCRKLNPMRRMDQQYGGEHDDLNKDYDKLMMNPDTILGQQFKDEFDAKGFLSDLFMVIHPSCYGGYV